MSDLLPQIAMAFTAVALVHAAWSDVATRTIPDGTSIAIAAVGAAARTIAGPAALASSVGLAVAVFCILVLAHSRGILGGGDVKLISATTIGLSPGGSGQFLSAVALAGGVLAIVHLALRHLPHAAPSPAGSRALSRVCKIERWRIRRHAPMPYGVAIAAGGIWVLLSTIGS